jgi:hypothetical protein
MLTIAVPTEEAYDQANSEFVKSGFIMLELEHSLVSLSKWESKFEKPFLSTEDKTNEETLWYVKAMTLTPNVPDGVYNNLSKENIDQVVGYINAAMTATTITDLSPQRRSREIITAEIIYYWMVALQIPFECQYWHLNRLITLVRVINLKNSPSKNMDRRSALQQQRELNRQRLAAAKTRG